MTHRSEDQSILRIIDAATNRAGEGMRVVEDYCRMCLADAVLTKMAKELRHKLSATLSSFDFTQLLQARDTLHDVGTSIKTKAEYQRSGHADILRSNFSRVQQSLRTIEEYAKTFEQSIAVNIEQIRYSTYSLEKAVANSSRARAELADARLYVLTDLRGGPNEFESLVHELIAAEIDLIQLRDKSATDRQLIAAGRLLTELTRNTSTRWIMNDRADLAALTDADGVHVGQDDLPIRHVRELLSSHRLVGVSTRNMEQVRKAIFECPDYIAIGPAFASATKAFESFASKEFIQHAVKEISLPLFAIGGINESNLGELIEMGVQRFAVSHCVITAKSPSNAVARLKSIISAERPATTPER